MRLYWAGKIQDNNQVKHVHEFKNITDYINSNLKWYRLTTRLL